MTEIFTLNFLILINQTRNDFYIQISTSSVRLKLIYDRFAVIWVFKFSNFRQLIKQHQPTEYFHRLELIYKVATIPVAKSSTSKMCG